MDRSKDKIGYEINFVKEFFKYKSLRDTEIISEELDSLSKEINLELNKILKL